MAITTIANMQIVPNKFAEYALQRTTDKSMLVRSGITVANSTVGELINGTPQGGRFIEMPFFKALTGEDEVFGEEDVGIESVATDMATATLLMRQKAWGDTDLSYVLGGADPMAAVANLVADWWVQREQAILLSILKGTLVAGGALESHILDVSADNGVIDVDTTLDAKQLMGDAYDKLGVVFMHSATYTSLQKKQQINTEYDSDLKVKIDYYLGYQVIVDDGMPASGGVYTTYFLGKGCIARVDGTPRGFVSVETDRDKIGAKNYLINRRCFVMHPMGLSWNAGATLADGKKYPANADLSNTANWTLKDDAKNVPMVALIHKI